MKKAVALPRYANVKSFSQPTGVVDVQLDKLTNRLATPTCPDTYTASFIAGTEPRDTCDQSTATPPSISADQTIVPPPSPDQTASTDPNSPPEKKKKGFFGKIAGIFKEDKSESRPSKPQDSSGAPPQ